MESYDMYFNTCDLVFKKASRYYDMSSTFKNFHFISQNFLIS